MLSRPLPSLVAAACALSHTPLLVAATIDAESIDAETIDAELIDEVVVTSERRELSSRDVPASLSALDAERIAAINAQHPHELMTRFPGVWISRGSGQESLPAIRSPVLTGAGACGAVLTLEDGIPTRPAGFCNVNQLFELNTEQAASIEVLRGPGNVLYGANALHGVINVLMPPPGQPGYLSLEGGANDFLRLQAALPLGTGGNSRGSVVYTDDGGFRVDTGYRQAKAYATTSTHLADGELRLAFSASDLDQQTGGFIIGEDAYRDPALRVSNPNPEAFREAASQRLYAIWMRQAGPYRFDLRPYVRHSDMEFLQHFLPGQPLESNGQTSAGLLAMLQREHDDGMLTAGVDLDWSDSWLEETQDGPADGSPFIVATRPAGKHYDYRVQALSLAVYGQAEWRLEPRLNLVAGLRAEYTAYDYDNRMLDGNTRDDGTPCDFGGCLYTRPADRRDDFTDLAPQLALEWTIDESMFAYLRAARGFRPPQTTELYRLQSGQEVADLDSETVNSVEAGLRLRRRGWLFDTAVYAMRKSDSVLRDAEGFNVSGGRSRHTGVEFNVDGHVTPELRLSAAVSYGRHEYDFDRVAAQGETFVAGRDVDTAPRWLGSVDAYYTVAPALDVALQWTAIGDYYLDAENAHEYPGHGLWNARMVFRPLPRWQLALRANNLADTRYADRADFAFGDYRYFPGRGREWFLELRYSGAAD